MKQTKLKVVTAEEVLVPLGDAPKVRARATRRGRPRKWSKHHCVLSRELGLHVCLRCGRSLK